jgi:hypothetical protein
MSAPQTAFCPACGLPAAGKFCSGCGASLTGRTCAGCRAELSPQARFCHRCGQPAGGGVGRSADRTAWLVAGVTCVVLVAGIVYKVTADNRGVATPDMANVGTPAGVTASDAVPGGSGGAPPDISQMTPRERFDALFNRIMSAAERGDRAEVERFTPMALGAYSQLDTADADARYHAAVLHLQADQAPEALALADTILAESPGHLFGYIVRGTAAEVRNDTAARRRAQQEFLRRYEAEMNARRVEYTDHRPVVDEFKRNAEAAGAR